ADAEAARGAHRALDYGESLGQSEQVQITDLHDDGFDGTGIIIAMLDTGFDTDHQAYRHLDILGERDFINDDAETADEPGDPSGQDSHGTATLSNVGAAYPGEIYGGSYNATFILCKTEMVDDEIQVEEDYWVEAVEYADSLGADLVSSSLGYFYWYDYSDMDGNTCVTTIAADMAAARGIVVVTSMGNEGGNEWKYMIAPADGDSVLGIGAVDIDGDRVSFSSVGPTYDDRIKPDVMALGLSAYVATTSDTASYGYSSGTSFSCPITAGAVGLLLQGHPEWIPQDVIDAVHSTASQSSTPDTLMGWGILQASDAMYSEPLGVGDEPVAATSVVWSAPNPFSPGTSLHYVVPARGHVRLTVFDVAGRVVRHVVDGVIDAGPHDASWDGRDENGRPVASGVYFARFDADEVSASAKLVLVR
ncbi:S8 family serine peptidase, partial [bacterium]|nr:S8 family serine peptidase [bacterium]